jgi:hypothetical protein
VSGHAQVRHGSVAAVHDADGIGLLLSAEVLALGCEVRVPLTLAAAQRLISDLSKSLISDGVLKGRGPRAASMPDRHQHPQFCLRKKGYASADAALAHAGAYASARVRAYLCECKKWHLTNPEKA